MSTHSNSMNVKNNNRSVTKENCYACRAVGWVTDNLSADHITRVSVPETVSKGIGGLLGAYELTNAAILLEKAALLTGKLMPAFQGTSAPLPLSAKQQASEFCDWMIARITSPSNIPL